MNTKSVLGSVVVLAVTLTASVALAASHGGGGSGGGGFSGGGSRGSGFARGGVGPGRPGTNFGRFRPGASGNFRNFRGNRFRHRFDDDDFFFFGDPFFFGYGFYPYGYYPYGYYPYGYYPPYGYGDGYGYGNGVYGQSGYDASAVVNIQRRLARAGYYHGRIDGVMGRRTREAMREYQRARGAREARS